MDCNDLTTAVLNAQFSRRKTIKQLSENHQTSKVIPQLCIMYDVRVMKVYFKQPRIFMLNCVNIAHKKYPRSSQFELAVINSSRIEKN